MRRDIDHHRVRRTAGEHQRIGVHCRRIKSGELLVKRVGNLKAARIIRLHWPRLVQRVLLRPWVVGVDTRRLSEPPSGHDGQRLALQVDHVRDRLVLLQGHLEFIGLTLRHAVHQSVLEERIRHLVIDERPHAQSVDARCREVVLQERIAIRRAAGIDESRVVRLPIPIPRQHVATRIEQLDRRADEVGIALEDFDTQEPREQQPRHAGNEIATVDIEDRANLATTTFQLDRERILITGTRHLVLDDEHRPSLQDGPERRRGIAIDLGDKSPGDGAQGLVRLIVHGHGVEVVGSPVDGDGPTLTCREFAGQLDRGAEVMIPCIVGSRQRHRGCDHAGTSQPIDIHRRTRIVRDHQHVAPAFGVNASQRVVDVAHEVVDNLGQ